MFFTRGSARRSFQPSNAQLVTHQSVPNLQASVRLSAQSLRSEITSILCLRSAWPAFFAFAWAGTCATARTGPSFGPVQALHPSNRIATGRHASACWRKIGLPDEKVLQTPLCQVASRAFIAIESIFCSRPFRCSEEREPSARPCRGDQHGSYSNTLIL